MLAIDARIRVTVSIGVAVLGRHSHDLFELLAAADMVLYKAEDVGRDGWRVRPRVGKRYLSCQGS